MRKKQITWLKRGLALSALLLLTAVSVPQLVISNSETATPSFIPSFVIEGQARPLSCAAKAHCCWNIYVECKGEELCSARSGSVAPQLTVEPQVRPLHPLNLANFADR